MTWSIRLQGGAAAAGVLATQVWPLVLIQRSADKGSLRDVASPFLGIGLSYAVVLAAVAGVLMTVVLRRASRSSEVGRLDPWGAYALGLGVHIVAVTALSALLLLLLVGANDPIGDRLWLIELLWISGHLLAAAGAVVAARAVIGRTIESVADSDPT